MIYKNGILIVKETPNCKVTPQMVQNIINFSSVMKSIGILVIDYRHLSLDAREFIKREFNTEVH